MRRFQLLLAASAAAALTALPAFAAAPQPGGPTVHARAEQPVHDRRDRPGDHKPADRSARGGRHQEHGEATAAPTLHRAPLLRHPEAAEPHLRSHENRHYRRETLERSRNLDRWDRSLNRADRDRARAHWRDQHRDWENRARWRRDRNWWRHSHAFGRYVGPRVGFFFIPAYGYVAAPPAYEHRYWRQGEYLPSWFWRYQIADYAAYELPAPPEGAAWVWVGNDVALIELDDGYIIDIVRNLW